MTRGRRARATACLPALRWDAEAGRAESETTAITFTTTTTLATRFYMGSPASKVISRGHLRSFSYIVVLIGGGVALEWNLLNGRSGLEVFGLGRQRIGRDVFGLGGRIDITGGSHWLVLGPWIQQKHISCHQVPFPFVITNSTLSGPTS